MNLLQYAFEEGRDTNISWENSESLKRAHLLELQMTNILSNREHKGVKRKVAQIHPSTGRIVNVFASAFAAARWVNQTKSGKRTRTRAYQCFGNIKMMMVNGNKAYGYYWLLLDPESDAEVTYTFESKLGHSSKPRKIIVVNDNTGETTEYSSIKSAVQATGNLHWATALLSRRLKELPSYSINEHTFFLKKKYQTTLVPKRLIMRNTSGHFKDVFESYADAAKHVNATVIEVINSVRYGHEISGYKFFKAA